METTMDCQLYLKAAYIGQRSTYGVFIAYTVVSTTAGNAEHLKLFTCTTFVVEHNHVHSSLAVHFVLQVTSAVK